MDNRLLRREAWQSVMKRTKVDDNGLLATLSAYERLDESRYSERAKTLETISKLAQAYGRDKSILASREASRFLSSLVDATREAKKTLQRDEANNRLLRQAVADLQALRSSLTNVATLVKSRPSKVKVTASMPGTCIDKELKSDMYAAALLTALLASGAAIASVTVAPPTIIAALGAIGVAILALDRFIDAVGAWKQCLDSHPEDLRRKEIDQLWKKLSGLKSLLESEKLKIEKLLKGVAKV